MLRQLPPATCKSLAIKIKAGTTATTATLWHHPASLNKYSIAQSGRQAGSELAHLQQLSRTIGQVICTFDTFVHLFVQLMNLHRQHTHTYTERHPNYKK